MYSIISVKKLVKDYNPTHAVVHSLRGIDLEIAEGDTVSIVGESGAGKSTLLHILGTLEEPTTGEVIINGINPFGNGYLHKKSLNFFKALNAESKLAKFRNENIGFVFQFHHLLPEFSALENVMMPALIRGADRVEYKERAKELLSVIGLADRFTHKPSELSGGEQQRVAIARAMILNPKILLADEPTGNLDSKTSGTIHDLLMELNAQRKTTMIIVTHNLNFAKDMNRVITLVDGKIA